MINSIQNFDLNFSTYVLLGLGFTVFNYSLYCLYCNSNSIVNKIIGCTHADKDQLIENIGNSISKMSNNLEPGIPKIEDNIVEVNKLVDKSVQFSEEAECNYLVEKYYEIFAPESSAYLPSDIPPTAFIDEYELNPEFKQEINEIVEWTDRVEGPSQDYLDTLEDLKQINEFSGNLDNVIEDISSQLTEITNLTNEILQEDLLIKLRIAKVDEILKIIESKHPGITSEPFFNTGFIENVLVNYSTDQLLTSHVTSEVVNLINSDILLYLNSSGMF